MRDMHRGALTGIALAGIGSGAYIFGGPGWGALAAGSCAMLILLLGGQVR